MDEILEVRAPKPVPLMMKPLVSIIIPTYNKLSMLKRCLESVIQYTDLESCEIIVVSNGCKDGTTEYLCSHPIHRRIEHLTLPGAVGFPAAVNEGIKRARGQYVVLLNNDTVLLKQNKNAWIEQLMFPFTAPGKVGVTGPVKFHWTCGNTQRRAIAFWCAMIPRALFDEIGLLDEAFSPGMGEDGDFCIKAEMAGYNLVSVPVDQSEEFGKGIPHQEFPIFHIGSGTFGEKDYSEVKKRNDAILLARYGQMDNLEEIYEQCFHHQCDTNQLFPILRKYAEQSKHVTEFGVRGVFTTWAFLAARPKKLVSYDIEYNGNIEGAKKEAALAKVPFEFRIESTLEATIEPTDLLFIDTTHTFKHLKIELDRHADKVSKWIAIHDTESFGLLGADGGPGEKLAIDEFLEHHPEWKQKAHYSFSNGLTILERTGLVTAPAAPMKGIVTSIIIPTCGKDWKNVLQVCLERVIAHTNWDNKELIIVPNGAPKEAVDYVRTVTGPALCRVLEFPERIGYIRAVNAGIQAAKGDYVILLDDDSILQPYGKDYWFDMLATPFLKDQMVGAAGPFSTTYDDLGQTMHSGCTMYRTSILRDIGMFDEAFNPGYMSDEDVSIRIRKAGYKLVEVPEGQKRKYVDGTFHIDFPVVHTGNVATMDKHGADLPLVKKNRDLLLARHSMHSSHGIHTLDVGNPLPFQEPMTLPSESSLQSAPAVWKPTVSIIIPTAFARLEDLLKPNLQSIIEYTDLTNVEVVVVANGCTDGVEEYVKSLGPNFKVISFPDAIGYTKATNEGIKVATGEFLVFYNNDNQLLAQPKNDWLDKLLAPFKDNPKMGITGPLQLHDDYADQDVIIGFCLCIRRAVLQDVMADVNGLLDEIYSPGSGEDIDLCCKARAKGYIVRQVPKEGKLGFGHTNEGEFQIWHKDNQTFRHIEEYTRYIVKRNGWINCKKFNKNIKLNIGSGGIEYPGYLSVDLHDRRATIIQDITKLDFNESSVAEMMAIHVVEHLSPYVVENTFKLWFKLLKPGGKLIIEMPDLESLCRRYIEANTGKRYGLANCMFGSVNTTSEGEPSDITSPHLFGWDKQQIYDHLRSAGFEKIIFLDQERFPHPEPPNMSLDAYKPG